MHGLKNICNIIIISQNILFLRTLIFLDVKNIQSILTKLLICDNIVSITILKSDKKPKEYIMHNKSTQKNTSRVVFYRDELNDEFSTAHITAKKIDASYKYDKTTGIYRISRFFWYRIVAIPLAWIYLKLK